MSSQLEARRRDARRWTPAEMMTIAAARALPDGATCLVGIGLPGTAANVARRLHAPRLVLVYESGAIGSKPGSSIWMRCGPASRFRCWKMPSKSLTIPT